MKRKDSAGTVSGVSGADRGKNGSDAGGRSVLRLLGGRGRGLRWVLVLAGALAAAYPFLTDVYAWRAQQALIREVQRSEARPAASGENAPLGPAAESPQAPAAVEAPSVAPGNSSAGDGEGWAVLEIPKLGLTLVVVAGTGKNQLMRAPGWLTTSALPGQGNTVIAGHRTMYGAPFRHLDRLGAGDDIWLRQGEATFQYRVERVFSVRDDDWSVTRPGDYPALTLLTCTPVGSSRQRLVVRAALVNPAAAAGE